MNFRIVFCVVPLGQCAGFRDASLLSIEDRQRNGHAGDQRLIVGGCQMFDTGRNPPLRPRLGFNEREL